MREWVRTRLASSSRVVEETPDLLVLQANWSSWIGVAAVFGFMGLVFGGAGATFQSAASRVVSIGVGLAFGAAGALIVAIGRQASRERFTFDRRAGQLRLVTPRGDHTTLPFVDVVGLERKTIEGLADSDSTLVYYALSLTVKGRDAIEVCRSRDPEMLAEIEAKVRGCLSAR